MIEIELDDKNFYFDGWNFSSVKNSSLDEMENIDTQFYAILMGWALGVDDEA